MARQRDPEPSPVPEPAAPLPTDEVDDGGAAGFAPPELTAEIAALMDNAISVELRREAPGKRRVVWRTVLQRDGRVVVHGTRPDWSDEQIAAELWSRAESDADDNSSGSGRYKITVCYAKPFKGPTATPATLPLVIGSGGDANNEAVHRFDLIGEMRAERRELFTQHCALMREGVRMAQAVGNMATGLANAFSQIHEKTREVAAETENRAMVRVAQDSERERMRMFEKVLLPTLQIVRAKMGLPAEASQPAVSSGILDTAHRLGKSLSASQRDTVRAKLGPRFLEIEHVADENDLLSLCTWLFGSDMDGLLAVYATLDDAQTPLVEQLQQWAVDRGDEHERSQAPS